MHIKDKILSVFPKIKEEPLVSDKYIESNQNIMEVRDDHDLLKIVPSYMLWCAKYKDSSLVDSNTINALAEYGRCKDPCNDYLNFKYLCSDEQRAVVVEFLKWCQSELVTVQDDQIDRSLKNGCNSSR